jgi:hypothetical protein
MENRIMFGWNKTTRNPFIFSLGGLTTIAAFVAAPAVDADRLNRALDERQSQLSDGSERSEPRRRMQSRCAHAA